MASLEGGKILFLILAPGIYVNRRINTTVLAKIQD